jgi:hypothetical protein
MFERPSVVFRDTKGLKSVLEIEGVAKCLIERHLEGKSGRETITLVNRRLTSWMSLEE